MSRDDEINLTEINMTSTFHPRDTAIFLKFSDVNSRDGTREGVGWSIRGTENEGYVNFATVKLTASQAELIAKQIDLIAGTGNKCFAAVQRLNNHLESRLREEVTTLVKLIEKRDDYIKELEAIKKSRESNG